MKNLFDIQCPQCGNFDNLYFLDNIRCIYLGPWWVPGDEDEMAWLVENFHHDSLIHCETCRHRGPFSGFDGDLPAGVREGRIMARFRELITLDYRQK